MEQFVRSSHFSGANAVYVEGLYETYLHSPNSVPDEWRKFFDSLPRVNGSVKPDVSHDTVVQYFELLGKKKSRPTPAPGSGGIQINLLAPLGFFRHTVFWQIPETPLLKRD